MLVDRPASLLDDRVDRTEEGIEEHLRLLGTERIGERREPHQVDEQNGDLPALMGWSAPSGHRQRRTTAAAVAASCLVREAARSACKGERGTASSAEPAIVRIVGAALRASHEVTSIVEPVSRQYRLSGGDRLVLGRPQVGSAEALDLRLAARATDEAVAEKGRIGRGDGDLHRLGRGRYRGARWSRIGGCPSAASRAASRATAGGATHAALS